MAAIAKVNNGGYLFVRLFATTLRVACTIRAHSGEIGDPDLLHDTAQDFGSDQDCVIEYGPSVEIWRAVGG